MNKSSSSLACNICIVRLSLSETNYGTIARLHLFTSVINIGSVLLSVQAQSFANWLLSLESSSAHFRLLSTGWISSDPSRLLVWLLQLLHRSIGGSGILAEQVTALDGLSSQVVSTDDEERQIFGPSMANTRSSILQRGIDGTLVLIWTNHHYMHIR